jgi:SLT domain-containing protein
VGAAPAAAGGNVGLVQAMAAARGWTGAQWDALYAVIMRESGFNNNAQNPTSTAYGMFQFLDSTWASYGARKTSDPAAQTVAGLNYIASRYGSPQGALAHEQQYGWYDEGGYLQPGLTLAMNRTGKPERILDAAQTAKFDSMVSNTYNGVGTDEVASKLDTIANILLRSGAGATVNVHDVSGDPVETARRAALALRLG